MDKGDTRTTAKGRELEAGRSLLCTVGSKTVESVTSGLAAWTNDSGVTGYLKKKV